jgi:hypothetical protein
MENQKSAPVGSLRTLGVFGLVLIGSFSVLICLFFFGGDILEYLGRRSFDPVAWKGASHSSDDPVRIRMVDDLLQRHQFRGMTREQVTALIGEPDDTPYFKDWDMVYWLGPERGFMSIDSEWLVFRLGDQKTVKDFRVVRD